MLTPPTIDSLVSNSILDRRTCIAVNKKGLPCGNRIAQKNVEDALIYAKYASAFHHGTPDLEWLAGLLLCRHSHQKRIDEISEIWQSQARHYSAHESTAGRRASEEDCDLADKDLKKRSLRDSHQPVPTIKTNVQTRSMTNRTLARNPKISRTLPSLSISGKHGVICQPSTLIFLRSFSISGNRVTASASAT